MRVNIRWITAASCVLFSTLFACSEDRFSDWEYSKTIQVSDRSGTSLQDFPVRFTMDTKALVRSGKMQESGADIRITVAGKEIPYQVEGMNSAATAITFQIALDPNSSRDDIRVYYGNPAGKPPEYPTDWGRIYQSMDGFENELMQIRYGVKTGTYGKPWGCQTAFLIKEIGEDQFGGDAIPGGWGKSRNDVTYWKENMSARIDRIEVDGPIYKRFVFHTDSVVSDDHGLLTDLIQRVTFYRNCQFFHEEYTNIKGAVVDAATPGGMPLRTEGERNFDFFALNFNSDEITWQGIGNDHETRGGWSADKERSQRDPRYRYLPDFALNGYFMMGVVNLRNGRGLASCAETRYVQTCYFSDWSHDRAAYSFWPTEEQKINRYFFYFRFGRQEAVTLTRQLALQPEVVLQ